MKRINSIGIGVVLIAALAIPAAPAVAKSHHGKRGHKARHHVVFHKRAHRHLTISDAGDPKVADRIGTIVSFAADTGTLTLKLDGGKTVEATVNDGTEIKCDGSTPPVPAPTVARSSHHGDDESGDYPGDGKRHCDHGDDVKCTTADLVAGAVVREAELRLTSDGLVFDEIKLAK